MSISGEVMVPVDVQQLFSAEQPGVVMIRTTKIGSGSNSGSLRYLCEPREQALTLPYLIDDFGCAEEQLVEARAFRVKADQLAHAHCEEPGIVAPGSGGLLGDELAYGAATIFPGQGGGPCSSGSSTAVVTLAVGAAP